MDAPTNTTNSGQWPPTPPMSCWQVRNARLFVAFRICFNARFYYPVFTILFLDFGLTLSQFAVLNAVWAATIVALEVPSGALADSVGRKKLLVVAGVLMVAEMAVLCLAPRGQSPLLFALLLVNRVLSGSAEAAASGADEAMAFDALKKAGLADLWGKVLETQMRWQSTAYIVAMVIGAAVYDPGLVQALVTLVGWRLTVDQGLTMRLPPLLTLVMAVLTLAVCLRFKEVRSQDDCENPGEPGCGASIVNAFGLTLRAGLWILKTPFVMVLILTGLVFDHVIRMVLTLSSQYYRVIGLPEATFGLIGGGLAMLGLVVPRLARHWADRYRPSFNLAVMAVLALAGLSGLALVMPIVGLLPMAVLMSVMYCNGFYMSHYLNQVTDSRQRATVLSFKGLAFNLAYGLIGILYSVLLAALRPAVAGQGLVLDIENAVFVRSIGYFPLYFCGLIVPILIFGVWRRQSRRSGLGKTG